MQLEKMQAIEDWQCKVAISRDMGGATFQNCRRRFQNYCRRFQKYRREFWDYHHSG